MVDEWNPECSFNAVQEAFDELGTMWGGFCMNLSWKTTCTLLVSPPFCCPHRVDFFGTIYKLKRRMVKKRPTQQSKIRSSRVVTKKLVTMLNKSPKPGVVLNFQMAYVTWLQKMGVV